MSHERILLRRGSLMGHFLSLTRVTLTGGMSGSAEPAAVRSTDCQVKPSLFRGTRRFVADTSLPSGSTPAASITQLLPSRVQADSRLLPFLSNCHDRSPPAGSLRMI